MYARGKRGGEKRLLEEGTVVPSGFESNGLESTGCEERGEVFVAGTGAATVQLVIGQECHVGVNFMLQFG